MGNIFYQDLLTTYNFSKYDLTKIPIADNYGQLLMSDTRCVSLILGDRSHYNFGKYALPSNLTELNITGNFPSWALTDDNIKNLSRLNKLTLKYVGCDGSCFEQCNGIKEVCLDACRQYQPGKL